MKCNYCAVHEMEIQRFQQVRETKERINSWFRNGERKEKKKREKKKKKKKKKREREKFFSISRVFFHFFSPLLLLSSASSKGKYTLSAVFSTLCCCHIYPFSYCLLLCRDEEAVCCVWKMCFCAMVR